MDINGSKDGRAVVMYMRVSTREQGDKGFSLDAQKRILSRVVDLHFEGAEVLEIVDVGSGTKDSRPGYKKLMAHLAGNQVRAVVVTDLDRLCRSLEHFIRLLRLLSDRAVSLVAHGQGFDTTSDMGSLIAKILMCVAEFESQSNSRRVRRVLDGQRAERRKGPGIRPYGWTVAEGGKLERSTDEQRGVDLAVALRSRGSTWQAVADALNGGGFKTVQGGQWSRESARGVISSAIERRATGF